MWMVGPPGRTTVAVDDDDTIVGTANMYANRPGPGEHVASGNYMVAAGRRGQGIGRALIEDSLRWAREAGFRAMQFNAIAESNTAAVHLYERVGRHASPALIAHDERHRHLARFPCKATTGHQLSRCARSDALRRASAACCFLPRCDTGGWSIVPAARRCAARRRRRWPGAPSDPGRTHRRQHPVASAP